MGHSTSGFRKTASRLVFTRWCVRPVWAKFLVPVLLLTPLGSPANAQPKSGLRKPVPIDVPRAEEKGKALVAELLRQKPEERSSTSGTLQMRGADRKTREVPVRFEIVPTPTNTVSTYEASRPGQPKAKLTVLSSGTEPNRYLIEGMPPGNTAPKALSGNETMTPFAVSDFWVADLGLEFLHWPRQLVLRQEMSRGQHCDVLESVNPEPRPGAYSRVVSWIAADRPGVVIVRAEAYDSRGELLKEFEPKKLEKVSGQWQLQKMEIRNVQANTRTQILFDLDNSK